MSASPGTRLGPYEITSALGAGGMGEVYLAVDTRLDRAVAIKILPEHLSADPGLRQRFEREARVISNLSHPNICTLFDVGQENGIDFLVMEHLEGESLAHRLDRGRIGADEALRIGREIAAALDKAHRGGVVHRDLKPGNVMLTKTGAKLLDFGLAKLAPVGQAVDELTSARTVGETERPLTEQGTIVGTFQYMAPEQLEGKEADARTDLFAFGAVLYEMVTGKKAFQGKSQASLIGAIMHAEPPSISAIEPLTPPALDRLIRACLTKDPEERIQTAHDVLLQLRWITEGGSQAGVPAPVAKRRRGRERVAWSAAGVLALACAAMSAILWGNRPAPVTPMRFLIAPPPGATSIDGPRLSPDGQSLAFSATDSLGQIRLWVQPLSALTASPLPGTEGAKRPWWSPDGRFLAYIASGKLRKIGVGGGPPQTICDAGTGADGAWGRDGTILFDGGQADPIRRVAASGGIAAEAVTRDSVSVGWPDFLPDGKRFLYLQIGVDLPLSLGSIDGKPGLRLDIPNASRAEYAPPGHILFVRDRTLLAQPFDVRKGRTTGEPVPVAEDVWSSPNGGAQFSVSRNGTLLYRSGGFWKAEARWRDREGRELERVTSPSSYANPWLAADGKRVLLRETEVGTGERDLWIMDTERDTKTRQTFGVIGLTTAVWSPDGAFIYYSAREKEAFTSIYRKPAGGVGSTERITEFLSELNVTDISRDGKYLALDSQTDSTGSNVAVLSLADNQLVPVVETPAEEFNGRFSPDGRWISYVSNESGRDEVYVQSVGGPVGKWQISNAGGYQASWRADGKELYYIGVDQQLTAVDIVATDIIAAGRPHPLFQLIVTDLGWWHYQPSPDGQRFLTITPESAEAVAPMTIVLNWAAALR